MKLSLGIIILKVMYLMKIFIHPLMMLLSISKKKIIKLLLAFLDKFNKSMRKLLIILILSFFSAQGYAAGCPDGSEPVKSISADDTYFVYNCGGGGNENQSSSDLVKKPVAGIDIENDPNIDFFQPPLKPYPTDKLYWFGRMWQMADFNKDGYSDVLYIGTMNPNNVDSIGETTGGACGGGACEGNKPLPSLYLGDANHKLTYAPELLIDNREDSGMSLGRQLLVADYNNDNILDFYVADHGIGTHDGVRDSYFLSQPNGTWVESSETHLSHSNFVVFDHGGATGDIDNDGDMDVVITETNWKTGTALWCLINDGTGYLNKRKCGGIFSFALELADMDGDGYLDVLLGAHESEKSIDFTGIVWNDGRGNFNKNNNTLLPQHKKKWASVPEVSAADLDNDGDLDIVYSRAGDLYVGTAIQIIENLGNKKFKDHGVFPLVEAPADFIPINEGNEWNDFIEMIKFRDLDKDGNIDLYLSSSMSLKTNGMVLINQGDFNFSIVKPSKTDGLYVKSDHSSVVITKKVLTSLAKTKETEDSIKFESSIKKNGKAIFEGVDQFTKFEFGIPLNSSGALLAGFKDLNVLDDKKLNIRIHIKYGNIDFSVGVCFEYYPQHTFMAARTSFNKNDWGGLKKIMPSSRCIGEWELDDNKSTLQKLGIYAVIDDIQRNAFQILEAIDVNSTTDLSDMRSHKK
jgi:hypothetical protein